MIARWIVGLGLLLIIALGVSHAARASGDPASGNTAVGSVASEVEYATDTAAHGATKVAQGSNYWGNPRSLADHYARHGRDFGATSANDYARQAHKFLERALDDRLPTKVDGDGVIRIYDPQTNTFGAYNPDGTTRTFFKPNSPDYFDRQPGRSPWRR